MWKKKCEILLNHIEEKWESIWKWKNIKDQFWWLFKWE